MLYADMASSCNTATTTNNDWPHVANLYIYYTVQFFSILFAAYCILYKVLMFMSVHKHHSYS